MKKVVTFFGCRGVCRSGCAGRPAQPDLRGAQEQHGHRSTAAHATQLGFMVILLLGQLIAAAEVPKSPYIAVVYRYADAMIKNNRDTHQFGQNDLRILFTLSELTNKPVYRDAADAQL